MARRGSLPGGAATPRAVWVALPVCLAAGICLQLTKGLGVLALWGSVPYVVHFAIGVWRRKLGPIAASASLMLGVDAWAHLEVLFFTPGSTDAVMLVFLPGWQLGVVMPIGLLVGSLVQRRLDRGSGAGSAAGMPVIDNQRSRP